MLRSEQNAIHAANAVEVMKAAGWTPQEEYPGSCQPWLATHVCGATHSPRYSHVQEGRRSCRSCANKTLREGRPSTRLREATAVTIMRRAALTPLVPYQGMKVAWAARHTCGRISWPRLDSILCGQGGCWICSSRRYVPELPGCVYLLQSVIHPPYPSPVIKVGVTNGATWKRKPAWRLLAECDFVDGTVPLAIERAIITFLNTDLGLEPTRSATNLTTKGFAEAFSVVDLAQAGVSVTDLVDRVNQEATSHEAETVSA